MVHEKFYCVGFHHTPSMGIYAGWVALNDSFGARQPVVDEQNDVAVIFSGECFAPSDPASELGGNRQAHQAARLLELYNEEDDHFFGKLNGLFSGVLIDQRKKSAFLFNDRYGIERVYVRETDDAMYFASEAKALLRVLPELRAFDEKGVAQYLAFGCTMDSQTLFRGISLLPGASLWRFQPGRCHKTRYFTPAEWEVQEPLSAEDFETEFDKTFRRVLPRYFDSVPRLGISLTGGLDTRMIMACRPETNRDPICYTFGGQCGETRDTVVARRVADACGLEHQVLRLRQDFFSEFPRYADRSVYATDACCGVLGAHEIYLNKQGRELATIRLTGNFGSEVLRSMSTFKPLGLSREFMNPDFAPHLECAQRMLAGPSEHPVTFAAFKEIPWNLFGTLAAGRSQVGFRTPYLDNEIVRLAFRAPENLRNSPGAALRLVKTRAPELGRIPTDRGHVEGDNRYLGGLKRLYFQGTFKLDYLSNEGLPHWLSSWDPILKRLGARGMIIGSHKYLHYRSWLRQELAPYLIDALTDSRIHQGRFWNSNFLNLMGEEHIRGQKNYQKEINMVLTLQSVERLLFRELPRGWEEISGEKPRNSEYAIAPEV
jgi:asparagine synthase (glutamine-hydrolysing)